jgi:hypothetical protein
MKIENITQLGLSILIGLGATIELTILLAGVAPAVSAEGPRNSSQSKVTLSENIAHPPDE